jgi:hypothetical protein
MPVTLKKTIGFILLLATLGLISWQALFSI